jgi:hypothetical protein
MSGYRVLKIIQGFEKVLEIAVPAANKTPSKWLLSKLA